MPIQTIGVTGAGGHLGQSVVRRLLSRAEPFRIAAFTRTPERLAEFEERGVDVRFGDFDHPRELTESFRGIDRLLIIPTSGLRLGVRRRQHVSAIEAAAAAGVRHVVYVSTVGARPTAETEVFGDHFVTEQCLFAAGVSWTVLRANLFADLLLEVVNRAVVSGCLIAPCGSRAAYASRSDIASAAAAILTTPGHDGAIYHGTGPVSISWEDMLPVIERIARKRIRRFDLSNGKFRLALAVSGVDLSIVDMLVNLQRSIRSGVFDIVTRDVERLTGAPAESALDFIERKTGVTELPRRPSRSKVCVISRVRSNAR
jgi:NAD(P)H dehydrogenase (quinone)